MTELRATSPVRRILRALTGHRERPPTGEPPARITVLDPTRRRDVLVMAGKNTKPKEQT